MLEKETKGSNRQNVRKQYKQEHSEARSRTCGEEKEHRQTNTVHTELIISSQDSSGARHSSVFQGRKAALGNLHDRESLNHNKTSHTTPKEVPY